MPETETGALAKIESWMGLSGPPFHTLGILPFCLGTFLAWRLDHVFSVPAWVLGMLGIVMVMLSTYHAGGHFALVENEQSRRRFRNLFAGESGTLPDWFLRRSGQLQTSAIFIALAVFIGIILQFGLKTGPFTLLLGCVGTLPGFFYATRPIRPADSGFGELLIAFCYGWLPIVAAFYIQKGYIAPCIHWMALPISLSIFNVVLLHEFPAQTANPAGDVESLLHRMGNAKGTALYCLTSILSWFSMYYSLNAGIPRKALYIYLPVMALSAGISLMMAGKRYENPLVLEILRGLNMAVHLGTTAACFLAFL
ncbi:MAG: prenyltransferase [Proteobacteria bacterium]|nr:prenyltransferase [Pseudomonadota bacterium]MCG2739585.1 prenyltransferase [Syntrophaceae bacterium]